MKWTGGPGDPGGLGVGLAEAPAQRCQAFRAAPPPSLQQPWVTTTIARVAPCNQRILFQSFRFLHSDYRRKPNSGHSLHAENRSFSQTCLFHFDLGVLEQVLALFPRAGLNCCTPPLIGKVNSTGFQVSEFGSFGLLFGFRGRPNNLRAQQSAEFLSIRLLCAPKM